MLKLAALGVLGYAGYKYYQKNVYHSADREATASKNKVAGGPLSQRAQVSPTAGPPAIGQSNNS